jgi:hypothetical protein
MSIARTAPQKFDFQDISRTDLTAVYPALMPQTFDT